MHANLSGEDLREHNESTTKQGSDQSNGLSGKLLGSSVVHSYRTTRSLGVVLSETAQARATQARGMARTLRGDFVTSGRLFSPIRACQAQEIVDFGNSNRRWLVGTVQDSNKGDKLCSVPQDTLQMFGSEKMMSYIFSEHQRDLNNSLHLRDFTSTEN